jgi:hypothetical protein
LIELIKNKIADFIISRNLRNLSEKQVNFKKFFSDAKSILLVMPLSDKDLGSAFFLIDQLYTKGKSLTLLIAEHRVSLLNTQKQVNYITYSLNDVSKLHLPLPALKSKLSGNKYNLSIDLNLTPDRFLRALSIYIDSDIKAGFKDDNADSFYNFQISKEINTKKSYENLLNSLNMF